MTTPGETLHWCATAGFTVARTTRRYCRVLPANLLELGTTVHGYNHWSDAWDIGAFSRFRPVATALRLRRWDDLAIALFDRTLAEGGLFHLWGHSWEIEQRGEWPRLERVLAYIGAHRDVAHVSNGELAQCSPR